MVQQPVSSLKVTPGLSAYAGQPENVGQSLAPLLEYAYKQVPLHHRQLTDTARNSMHTPVILHLAAASC